RLSGKVCLITGAGSGMGRSAALAFAREGAAVAAFDNRQEPLDAVVAEVHKAGGKCEGFLCDVSKEADVKKAVAAAAKKFGKLTALYNNAGIFPSDDHSVTDTEEKVWDLVYAVNVKGIAWVCKYGI